MILTCFYRLFWASTLILTSGVTAAPQEDRSPEPKSKIIAAYFEEWSIYGANYNVADIQNSGAADFLTHVLYAFANVNSSEQCALADGWADY